MRRVLKLIGFVVGGFLLVVAGFLLYVQVNGIPRYDVEPVDLKIEATPERVARGKKLATLLCAQCHMDPVTKQLTGKRMSDAPPEFGPIYSKNITKHPEKGIGSWTDGEIVYLLRTGVARDGQYIPPYMAKLPHMSDEDIASIVAFLRSDDPLVAPVAADPPGKTQPTFLTKFLSHVAFRKLPYPEEPIVAPPLSDKVAYGRYLVTSLDCFPCHSADFKTMNIYEPEKSEGYMGGGNQLVDLNGKPIWSSNLTADEKTGIGKWSEADFARAMRQGFRPDNQVVRYPMAPMPELSDEELAALYAYLRSVPKIENAVPRVAEEQALAGGASSEGKRLYYKYGCVACHGESGVGIADLRKAAVNFPTDEQLVAWLKNAPAIKPGTKMPAWEGVIAEGEFAPLIAYIKELGQKAP